MALNKVTYTDNETVITAKNLNDIQDEIIANGQAIENGPVAPTIKATYDEETQTMKFENVPKEVEDQLYAPSGYGLGQEDTYIIANANTALKDGRYGIDASTYQTPIADNGVLVVVSRDANVKHQTIYYSNSERTICHRDVVGGYFQPWEFENPPMFLGVEYRTTERCEGKVVYAKRIDCGAAQSSMAINHGVTATNIIRYSGTIADLPMPVDYGTSYNAKITVLSSAIYLWETGYDGLSVKVSIWYTKD